MNAPRDRDEKGVERLRKLEDLEAFLERSERGPCVLFKHSTRCPVSAWARGQFLAYARAARARGTACAEIYVVEDRSLSNAVSDRLGVVHQSPQAIVIRDGIPTWHASHHEITTTALEEAERAAAERRAAEPPP